MLDGGFTEFKLDYAGTKDRAIGDVVVSDDISVGGHIWKVQCFPHGYRKADNGVYLSLYLKLVSESKNVKAIFDAFVMGRDGAPSSSHAWRWVHLCPPEGFQAWGAPQFVKRTVLESDYLVDGTVTFLCRVVVLRDDDPIAVPPSDVGGDLGRLLDSAVGSDVTFSVGDEKFNAHRALLAARSPVLSAQLFGAMADATMRSITLHGVEPATFRILLRFMYTEALPPVEDTDTSWTVELFQGLLAAADMYQMERLKLTCAQKLWERVSAQNVASVLGFAETHSCAELKKRCVDFFVAEKNFKVAVLTEGYLQLMQTHPSVIDEIRARVQA